MLVSVCSRDVSLITAVRPQGASGNQSTEDLIKQPDFSDKIKQLLGSLQQTQNQNQGGPPPGKLMMSHGVHLTRSLWSTLF